MILIWFILLPLIGGLVAWLSERLDPVLPRWIALITLFLTSGLAFGMCVQNPGFTGMGSGHGHDVWLVEFADEWIPQVGISFHLAMDGLSLLLVLLSAFLGLASVAASWTEIRDRTGFFHLQLMLVLAGINGVFLAMDLFVFYFFWELMLVPMYFLIDLWGHERRHYAAVKFFVFTQLSGLLMLIAIVGLYLVHGASTGVYTFDYMQLLRSPVKGDASLWLMLGFFIAFAVKLPAVGVHTWLPDAHTQAPTAGSVILAGLLLKTGAYGLLRFVIPLFPAASHYLAPAAMVLAVAGILYGAVMAFAQTDLKRLVAYTSVSHMGFVLLGIYAGNTPALQGAVLQMLCHGVSTGALFMIVGALQERIHTRDMGGMGGLWSTAPRMGAVALFFALASLGLPGLGNFVGEFLVLLGAYKVNYVITATAALGFVAAVVYSLWMFQSVFLGQGRETAAHSGHMPDFGFREMAVMGAMMLALVYLGLYPQPVFDIAKRPLENIRLTAAGPDHAGYGGKR
ncbi:MAG TPA: NADH-quinone oxidoreductase subunit M [Dissulfurispiraceae bacterium]|nr:NADH-quinone oxidoreductase subunit M [Dissulfurispiraceae bacterium]